MDILIIKKSVYFLYIRLFYGDKQCPHPKKRMLRSTLKLANQLVAANKPLGIKVWTYPPFKKECFTLTWKLGIFKFQKFTHKIQT